MRRRLPSILALRCGVVVGHPTDQEDATLPHDTGLKRWRPPDPGTTGPFGDGVVLFLPPPGLGEGGRLALGETIGIRNWGRS